MEQQKPETGVATQTSDKYVLFDLEGFMRDQRKKRRKMMASSLCIIWVQGVFFMFWIRPAARWGFAGVLFMCSLLPLYILWDNRKR